MEWHDWKRGTRLPRPWDRGRGPRAMHGRNPALGPPGLKRCDAGAVADLHFAASAAILPQTRASFTTRPLPPEDVVERVFVRFDGRIMVLGVPEVGAEILPAAVGEDHDDVATLDPAGRAQGGM